MNLGSSITLKQVLDAYKDNASYQQDGSVAKAQEFVTACTLLMILIPSEQSNSDTTTKYTVSEIRKLKEEAQVWLNKKGSGTGYSKKIFHADFTDFRS